METSAVAKSAWACSELFAKFVSLFAGVMRLYSVLKIWRSYQLPPNDGGRVRLLFAHLSLCASLLAAPIGFGTISFDVLIPEAGQQLGVNVISIQNLTGPNGLAPDFPITSTLTLDGIELTIAAPGGSQVLSLGSLGPGSLASVPSLQFSSDSVINSLTLSGTLNQTTFGVSGAGPHSSASGSVIFVLSPSTGSSLLAGVDLGVIFIEAEPDSGTPVPEPGTLWLVIPIALMAGRRLWGA